MRGAAVAYPESVLQSEPRRVNQMNNGWVSLVTRCGSFSGIESDVLSRRPQPLSRRERGF